METDTAKQVKKILTRHVLDGARIGQGVEGSIIALELSLADLVAQLNPRLRMRMSMEVDKQASAAGVIILDVLPCLGSKIVKFVVGDVGDFIMLDSFEDFSVRIKLASGQSIDNEMASLTSERPECIVGSSCHVLGVLIILRLSLAIAVVLRRAGLGPIAGRSIPAPMRAIVDISGVEVTIMPG